MICITGGSGYIGRSISWTLQKARTPHILVDKVPDITPNQTGGNSSKYFQVDVLNTKELSQIFINNQVDVVIHCAGLKNASESNSKRTEYFRNNVVGTQSLLKAMEISNTRRLIFSSSAGVYGAVARMQPIQETEDLLPINYYSETKLAAENLIASTAKRSDLAYVVFRYFNVIGRVSKEISDSSSESVLSKLLFAYKLDSEFSVFGNDYPTPDGTAIRDYLDMKDLVNAHLLGLNYLNRSDSSVQTLNLGSGRPTSILELIKTLESVESKSLKYSFKARRYGDPIYSQADIKRAYSVLGWQPTVKLHQSLKDSLSE
jgi:UDP-glucose 4-epimerase